MGLRASPPKRLQMVTDRLQRQVPPVTRGKSWGLCGGKFDGDTRLAVAREENDSKSANELFWGLSQRLPRTNQTLNPTTIKFKLSPSHAY